MKYFANIQTAEELKKKFRELAKALHPDQGGNADEFKAMLNEYETIIKDFDRIKEEQEAKREAAEYRKRWEREEAERKAEEERQAKEDAEKLRPIIAKWAAVLETVPEAPDYCADAKTQNKYTAAVKRNLKAIFAHYFPGVKVNISISNKAYYESAVISWTDGPTIEEVRALSVWDLFTSKVWNSDPYADYGYYESVKSTEAWREKFGSVYKGVIFERDFSEVAKLAMFRTIWEVIPTFEGCKAGNDEKPVTLDDLHRLFKSCCPEDAPKWREDMTAEERKAANRLDQIESDFTRLITYYSYNKEKQYLSSLTKLMAKYWHIPTETAEEIKAEEEKPAFIPEYGKVTKAIKKALGTGKELAVKVGKKWQRVDLLEALEAVSRGETVALVRWSFLDCCNEWSAWAIDAGGVKVCEKRNVKFEPLGLHTVVNWNARGGVYFDTVTAETLEAVRREFAEVEAQRQKWEEAQKNPQPKTESEPQPKTKPEPQTESEPTAMAALAKGLQLVEIVGGVAVVGDAKATYKARKEIKAHGAKWNRTASRWEATEPEAVESLRQWFAVSEDEPQTEPTAEPETEPTALEAPQSDNEPTAGNATTETESEPQSEPTAEPQTEPTADDHSAETFAAFVDALQQFASVWGMCAEVQTEPTEENGGRFTIRFAPEDCPELDEIPTNPEAEAPTGAAAEDAENINIKPEEVERVRKRFEHYNKKAAEATEENEHTNAVKFEALALIDRYGKTTLKAGEIVAELEAIEKRHEQRGNISVTDYNRRAEIEKEIFLLCLNEYGETLTRFLFGRYTDYFINELKAA